MAHRGLLSEDLLLRPCAFCSRQIRTNKLGMGVLCLKCAVERGLCHKCAGQVNILDIQEVDYER
jgi:hypothetical protein